MCMENSAGQMLFFVPTGGKYNIRFRVFNFFADKKFFARVLCHSASAIPFQVVKKFHNFFYLVNIIGEHFLHALTVINLIMQCACVCACVFQFMFLAAQGFLIFSPQSSLLMMKPRKTKITAHWVLMLLATCAALGGMCNSCTHLVFLCHMYYVCCFLYYVITVHTYIMWYRQYSICMWQKLMNWRCI